MSDWIDDIFERQAEACEVSPADRQQVADLLESAYLTLEEKNWLSVEIYSAELTVDRWVEIRARLLRSQPPVRDLYAPSQRQLSRFLRDVCETTH